VAPRTTATEADSARGVAAHGLHLDEDGPTRLITALADEARQAKVDQGHLAKLTEALRGSNARRVDVPALAYDVHDVKTLAEVARVLVG
jgi:hypothetical protein